MPTARQTITARENFISYLRAGGRRVTAERLRIFDAVAADGIVFTAESLHANLNGQGYPISLATVYNTLQVMVDAGVVRCIRLADRVEACYQLATSSSSGVYCVCDMCGALRQVAPKDLMRYISNHEFTTFDSRRFTLIFQGLCRKCERKLSAKNKSKKTTKNHIINQK